MTQQYDKTNTFAIFINDRKELGSKQPDRTGTINVDGVEYFMDAWLGKTQAGATYLQGKVKRKDKQPNPPQQQHAPRQAQQAPARQAVPARLSSGFDEMDGIDSEIPFVSTSMHYDIVTSKARRMATYDY
jgi:hypothetical protein